MPARFDLVLNEINSGRSPCRFADYLRTRNGWRHTLGISVMKTLKTAWNDDNNKRVIELAAAGASAARASVALNRSISAVRIQASKLGTPFLTNLTIKKNQLAKCAAAERALRR
jgi:hypothetical protein